MPEGVEVLPERPPEGMVRYLLICRDPNVDPSLLEGEKSDLLAKVADMDARIPLDEVAAAAHAHALESGLVFIKIERATEVH